MPRETVRVACTEGLEHSPAQDALLQKQIPTDNDSGIWCWCKGTWQFTRGLIDARQPENEQTSEQTDNKTAEDCERVRLKPTAKDCRIPHGIHAPFERFKLYNCIWQNWQKQQVFLKREEISRTTGLALMTRQGLVRFEFYMIIYKR